MADASVNKEERVWAMVVHLSALAAFTGIPLAHIIAPLVIWLIKRDQYPLVADQGREAVNAQITLTIYILIAAVLCTVVIGFFLLPAVGIAGVVLVIIAGLKANEGERYRYPWIIRFIK